MKHLFFISIILLAFSCSKSKDSKTISTSNHVTPKKEIDYSDYELIVERGAFHYDTFKMANRSVTFLPSKHKLSKKYNQYNLSSEQKLSKEVWNSFFKKIEEEKIWEMKSVYDYDSHYEMSDNSPLYITIKKGTKEKRIKCVDYKRTAPEFLQFIEKEVVKLHGKNLKRFSLPG